MLINIRNEHVKHVKYKNAHTYSKYCMFDNQKHNTKSSVILVFTCTVMIKIYLDFLWRQPSQ